MSNETENAVATEAPTSEAALVRLAELAGVRAKRSWRAYRPRKGISARPSPSGSWVERRAPARLEWPRAGARYGDEMQIVAYALMSLSAVVAAGNLAGMLSALAAQRRGATRGFSCVPLLSCVLGLLAWVVGHAKLGLWALVPTFFDVGTWTVPVAIIQQLRSRRGA